MEYRRLEELTAVNLRCCNNIPGVFTVTIGSMGETKLFQQPTIVKLSDNERSSGVMEIDNVAKAVIAMHRDGFVVLENVVDPEHCKVLDKLMCEEAERMKTDPKTIWNDVSDQRSIAARI